MRKINSGNGSCLPVVLASVLVLCVALASVVLPVSGVASAGVRDTGAVVLGASPAFMPDVPPGGALRPLMMKAPEEPAASDDVDLPQAPK